MKVDLTKAILATVVLESSKDKVASPGLGPVFVAENKEEQQKISMYLSRIMEAVAHDLENDVMVVVKH
ncbi:MAG: hypothetical protein FH749_09295 [Firmicutes bacterium]|nr:hypothetical protein [Bacillota bacterium]